MTVCIAALCEDSKCLVTVSDNKVSFGDFSAENLAIKNIPFWAGEWTVQYAGNDVSQAAPIQQYASDLLRAGWVKKKQGRQRKSAVAPRLVADALDAAFAWRLQQEIETSILRPFGFTLETFRRQGKQQCTETQHAEICHRISTASLGDLVFLLAGFDSRGDGHIWSIDGVNAPRNYDALGMCAIGSGARAALSTMAFHVDAGHLRFKYASVTKAMYCALTAKFIAESATDVGRSTFALILRGQRGHRVRERLQHLDTAGIAAVRDRWASEGAPRFPQSFIDSELALLIKQ